MPPSSSTSSSDLPRALPAWAVVGLAGLTCVGLEVAVRVGYTPPGVLLPKVAAVEATLDAGRRELLLFGTCIAFAAIDHTVMDQGLGANSRLADPSAPGSTTLDWYLTLRTIDDPAKVDGVLVLYTPGDLWAPPVTWQSQSFDLMDLDSMREVAWWWCSDAQCTAELYARKLSLLYRNRGYLANRTWAGMGARGAPAPLEIGASQPYTPRATGKGEAPWHFVGRMVAEAKARGTPLLFVELPGNPEWGDAQARASAKHTAELTRSRLTALGAPVIVLQAPSASGYKDDVHFTPTGRVEIARQLVAALADRPELQR